jgi:adenylosuccinate synthase
LHDFEPVYEKLPGWQEDITSVRQWNELPRNARSYIQHIEDLVGIKIRLISVGPERDQVIERNLS